jgi:AcrR family transcriptional regulator
MARPSDPSIRADLRDRAIDYVLANGLTGLSLRPMAEALGTSARMLVYHFGTREGLMQAVLEGMREREGERIERWFRTGKHPRTLGEFFRWYWKRLSSPAARPVALLIFELYALALRDPKAYPGVLEQPVVYWQRLLARAGVAPGAGGEATATLLLAATRGFLLDLLATGERARVERAVEELARSVDRPSSRAKA